MITVVISFEDLLNTENQEALILERLRGKGAIIGQGTIEIFDNDMMRRKVCTWISNEEGKHDFQI